MVQAGMDVARLNFSHGDFDSHRKIIESVRKVSRIARRRVAILADLPGPKIRIGLLAQEPIEIKAGHTFTLTTQETVGDVNRVSVNFERLPQTVKRGNTLFLNDGFIQLEATRIERNDVQCRVVVGGQFRSRAGLNLPGVDLGISALPSGPCVSSVCHGAGIDAISQSFVESAATSRPSARLLPPWVTGFIIAKVKRSRALDHMDEIRR
jgi:pyruvate kinase